MNTGLLRYALPLVLGAVLTLAGCGGSGSVSAGSVTAPGGGVAPTISSTSPANGVSSAPTSRSITATFDTAMAPASLTPVSFSATSPSGPLTGAVSYVGNTATLLLNSTTPANTDITAMVTVAAKDLAGTPISNNYIWRFHTGSTGNTTPPSISSTNPASGATGIPTNQQITVVFSESMAAATVNTSTFKLQTAGLPVAGSVSLLNNVAVFKPAVALATGATFTATITSGVQDLSGNALAANDVWSFTTGTSANSTAPTIVSTIPAASATGVPINESVSVTFSDAMDVASLNSTTMNLKLAGSVVPTTISYAGNIAVLKPNATLAPNRVYTATVTTGVKNSSEISLATQASWSFTTAANPDDTPPVVVSTNPANLATNVFLNQSINATFSKPMQAGTLNTLTFSVAGVAGTVAYNTGSQIASFSPLSNLAPNTTYTATISQGAQDLAGNGLATQKTWTFTTGTQLAQPPINLGGASTYAVLAGSTVTNAGPTIINGDLGVSPGTAVTGFPPGVVNGSIHAGDATAANAKTALLAAELNAAGRLGGATLPGDLSGLTFTPGLYTNSSSVMISSGAVTLDAQGDPNAVFIFQMATTLTTGTGTQVVLAGGAQASNIYWSVGSSATLGVNSIFNGVVLAAISITVNNGATSNGTFLTQTGAVTLEANTVTRGVHIRP